MKHGVIGLTCAMLIACGDRPMPRLPGDAALADARRTRPQPAPALPSSVFVSGHSLTDMPYPEHLAAIVGALGQPLSWQRQYIPGSTIRQRSPPALPPGQFDALVITEQHAVLNSLAMDDTRRYLREWHDFYISRNPAGQTWFYMPWLSLDDPLKPSRWIAYERAAAHVWQCTVSKINAELRAAGRTDQIRVIPASLALAYLAEALPRGSGPAIFTDEVHLTSAGMFYMALVTAGSMAGGLPADLSARMGTPPDGVSAESMDTLVRIAARYHASVQEQVELSESGCRQFLADSFIDDYWNYYHDAFLARYSHPLKASWKAWRMRRQTTPLLLGPR